MVPRTLLPVLLDRLFPVISGPAELPCVVELLEDRGGEYCASLRTDPEMIARCCWSGFLPMSEDFTGHDVLLIKSHEERCVLDPHELHVSRSTRRRARGMHIHVDREFERCLAATVDHHRDRWLTEPLCESLVALHHTPQWGVAARSIELYAGEDLIAGEIGYSCGTAYTSLSGFHTISGAGSVQLAALGVLLRESGFAFWDLGMEVEYKLTLGARRLERRPFLDLYRSVRDRPTPGFPGVADCAALLV